MSIRRMGHRCKREKNGKPATLNLVSLMDIFTMLVFFLMVNSSEVEVIELQANIKLPDSNAQHRPEERLLISVNADDLIVQGIKVASIARRFSNYLFDVVRTRILYSVARYQK
jgi:biopolymer transport protein ExbD